MFVGVIGLPHRNRLDLCRARPLIPLYGEASDRHTLCVSTQVGCAVGCAFCMTGRDGLRGATFSSMTMDAQTGEVSGASVQIGDPITEKGLIEVSDTNVIKCCLKGK